MAHVGEKLALGAVGCLGRFFGADQFALSAFARRDVRAGADKFDDVFAILIVVNGSATIRPVKPGAVLALDAVFDQEHFACVVRLSINRFHPLGILGMNSPFPRFPAAREFQVAVAEQFVDSSEPIDLSVIRPVRVEQVAGAQRHEPIKRLRLKQSPLRPFSLHDLLLQFGGASDNALLQLVARLLQGSITLLNLLKHFVEAVNQPAQFVLTLFARADGVVLFAGHGAGRPFQLQNRIGDDALKFGGQEEHHQCRDEKDGKNNRRIKAEANIQFL